MKPRTRIQKEVVRLSSGLPELTDKQKAYAFEHCFKHHAYRTKGGTITCSECGHRWKGGHTLAETICGCSCPHCGKELEILDTRKRVFRDSAYYEIITMEDEKVASMLQKMKKSSRWLSGFLESYRPPLDGEVYLTDKEVADLLRVSRRTLQEYRNERLLPYIILGGKALYPESGLREVLEANYRKPFR